jgi:hypothetical protein
VAPSAIQRRSVSICAAVSFFVLLGRRHDLVFVGGENAVEQVALFRTAGDDGGEAALAAFQRAFEGVETELGLAVFVVRAVAMVTVFREDRLHLPGEVDGGVRNTSGTKVRKSRARQVR